MKPDAKRISTNETGCKEKHNKFKQWKSNGIDVVFD